MTNKTRGSDQLKLNCATFSALTQEEVMQVAGGATNFLDPILIKGQPAVWLSQDFKKNLGSLANIKTF